MNFHLFLLPRNWLWGLGGEPTLWLHVRVWKLFQFYWDTIEIQHCVRFYVYSIMTCLHILCNDHHDKLSWHPSSHVDRYKTFLWWELLGSTFLTCTCIIQQLLTTVLVLHVTGPVLTSLITGCLYLSTTFIQSPSPPPPPLVIANQISSSMSLVWGFCLFVLSEIIQYLSGVSF